MTSTSVLLPELRKELTLLPAPKGDDGRPRWFLFDPVKNAFHVLTRQAVEILRQWRAETPKAALLRLRQKHPDWHIDEAHLKDITAFLYQQNLTVTPPSGHADVFSRQDKKTRKPILDRVMQSSLFFRIPIFSPHKFLSATSPFTAVFFRTHSWLFIALLGVIGVLFTARQWDEFLATFIYFFTPEGLVFYVLALTVIKVLHELGHAYTAHHFGARVPIMGVAFLLLFPVLYTDTTDAWRLPSRRERALIDAGGLLAEFAIACAAIFLWSFLPDGPARSVAFFTATTSWGLSLIVNLNPCMRFDGYYLLSDVCGFQNMQDSGFALGRWKMRKLLWGLDRPNPLGMARRKTRILLTYAYATWVYRFFLFIAIGSLAYNLLPKPFGLVFFGFVISTFLFGPILRELKHLRGIGRVLFAAPRARLTLIVGGFSLLWFFIPWQNSITAPALIQPTVRTDIYPLTAAYIEHIHVRNGEKVGKGDKLFTLSSERLTFRRDQSRERLSLLKAHLNRQAATLKTRREELTLREDYAAELLRLGAIDTDIENLMIYAQHDGVVSGLNGALHPKRYIKTSDRLLRLSSAKAEKLIALPKEEHVGRIVTDSRFVFISSDASARKMMGRLTALAPTSENVIKDRILTSVVGGAVAVNTDAQGQLIPHIPVFRLHGETDKGLYLNKAQRGVVTLKAKPQSPASKLWRSVMRVLIREADF
ncbi:site-2 protease family protein [Hellea balneolensis]|uniref:site-2 protease family protein n=1 Tax=Hellea balneolensis TaxID=287478 RepID=UPI00040CC62E|nr:site-2 protease family protein [Hellea balneolensis]